MGLGSLSVRMNLAAWSDVHTKGGQAHTQHTSLHKRCLDDSLHNNHRDLNAVSSTLSIFCLAKKTQTTVVLASYLFYSRPVWWWSPCCVTRFMSKIICVGCINHSEWISQSVLSSVIQIKQLRPFLTLDSKQLKQTQSGAQRTKLSLFFTLFAITLVSEGRRTSAITLSHDTSQKSTERNKVWGKLQIIHL